MKRRALFYTVALFLVALNACSEAVGAGQVRTSDIVDGAVTGPKLSDPLTYSGKLRVGSGTPAQATADGSAYVTGIYELGGNLYLDAISGPALVWIDSAHLAHAVTLDSTLAFNTGTGTLSVVTGGGVGTVTSVGLTLPGWLAVTGSPVTTAGTLSVTAATGQPAHEVIGTGAGSAVALQALTTADLPSTTPTAASGTVNTIPKVTATGPVTYGDSSLTDDAVTVKTSETYWTKHGASSNATSPVTNPGTFGLFSDQQPTVSTTSTAYRSLFFWEEPGSGSNVAKSFRGLEGDATTAPLDTSVYTNANAFLGALIQSLYAGDSPGSAAGSIGVFAIAGKSAGISGSTGTGVLTAAKAVEAQVSAAGTGGSITNGYGVYVLDAGKSGSATIGTDYGLYLENQDKGTTNYTMYSAGGVNAFAGSPSASATSSQLMIGPAAIAAGSSSGNYVGINATAGYGGYFTEYEVNGVAKQFLDASGNLTLAGKSTVVGTVNTGGMKVHRTAVASGSYTILVTDYYVAVTGTSGATLTLPSAATAGAGAVLIVKDAGRGAGASNITINRAGSDTIDGATSLVMATNAQSVTLISDGVTNWEAN